MFSMIFVFFGILIKSPKNNLYMIYISGILELFRFLIGLGVLLYASYTDIKTRRAPNILWIIMVSSGLIILLLQYLTYGFGLQTMYLVFIPIMIGLMYMFFQLHIIFGGADAKALMSLAILIPFWPNNLFKPPWVSPLPFSWVVFSNSIVLFLIIPLSLLIYNFYKGDRVFPHCLLGYKMDIEKAKNSFVWPLEKIVDGKIKLRYTSHISGPTEDWEVFEHHGIKNIWVTPKIPFMIPLLLGFIFSFLIGDILYFLTHLFL